MNLIEKKTQMNWQQCWILFWYHRSSAFKGFFLSIIVATILAIGVERNYQASGKIQLPVNNQIQNNLKENIYFFYSYSTINQVIEDLQLVDKEGNLLNYNQFIVNFDITQNTESNILNVTYTGKDTAKSKLVVDYLIKSYINHQIKTQKNKFIEIENNLKEQLILLEIQLQQNQKALNSFLGKYDQNILQATLEYNFSKSIIIEEKITELAEKITALKLQLSYSKPLIVKDNHHLLSYESEAIVAYLEQNQEQVPSNNNKLNLKNRKIIDWNLANIPPKKELWKKYQENPSSFLSSSNQNSLETIDKTNQILWSTKSENRNNNNISLSIKKQYQNLLYKTKIAETNYNTLAQTIEQLNAYKKQKFAYPVQINSVTIKNNLASWNKEIIIISGIAVGLVLSFTTIFILEKKNPALKTPKSIYELFNTQLLATIPNFKPLKLGILNSFKEIIPERLVLEAPYSLASEAYKLVYKSLQSNSDRSNIKLITIASPIAQEGKSTLCANFATLTARIGKKVLLVDANFYQPRQHEIWGLSNIFGLTNFLKSNAKFEDIVQSPSLNLDIITTGFILGDGLSLLQSETMQELVDLVKKQYDLIIFDSPSINLYPNALTINKFTDGLVLVCRTGVTDVQSIIRAKELIEKSQQKVLGIVINDKNASF